ncbi:MAG: flagellar motor protein MotB, partial [Bacteroidota bacterium]
MRNHSFFILSVVGCLLMAGPVSAQYNPDKVNPKATRLNAKAMELAQSDDFKAAIATLLEAVKIDPQYEEAYLSLAGMYGEMKNYPEAVANYEKARAIDSLFFIDYNLPYSIDLAGLG